MKNFILSLRSYLVAINLIREHGLLKFFLIPLLLNIIYFVVGISFAAELNDWINLWIQDWIDIDHWSFMGSGYLVNFIYVIIWILVRLIIFFILVFTAGHIIQIILSPLFAYLSEKLSKY